MMRDRQRQAGMMRKRVYHTASLIAQWGPCRPVPLHLLSHSAGSVLSLYPRQPSSWVFNPLTRTFFLPHFGGDRTLLALEKSTPVSTSSCSPGSLVDPTGMLSASKQWEVHLEGPADGAYAASTQVPPPSSGHKWGLPGLIDNELGLSASLRHRSGGEADF